MFPDLTRDEVFMIGTARLWLRWPRRADAARFAAINGHPDVASLTASWPVGCDTAFADERITMMRAGNTAGTNLTLAITARGQWSHAIGVLGVGIQKDAATGRLVGQLGYALDPAAAGDGVMTEAVAGLLDMVRLLTRVDRVEAGVMAHNAASIRVLEKTGFNRGAPYVHESPVKGPIEVIRYTRVLRSASVQQLPRPARISPHQPSLKACA